MIDQSEAMQVLLDACPSFEDQWKRHVEAFGHDVLYPAAGELAAHLLERFQAGATEAFNSVGTAIERLHTEGTPWFESSPPSACSKEFRMFGATRRQAPTHSFRSSARNRSAGGEGSTGSGQGRRPMWPSKGNLLLQRTLCR